MKMHIYTMNSLFMLWMYDAAFHSYVIISHFDTDCQQEPGPRIHDQFTE